MKRPDCVVVEEHHEVFAVWREALRRGRPLRGAAIVHLDEHSDLGLPELSRPIPPLEEGWGGDWRFVHEELNIGSFLIAGLSLGVFSSLWWHRCARVREEQRRFQVIASGGGRFMRLETAGRELPLGPGQEVAAEIEYFHRAELSSVAPTGPFVLDICLDYFASHIAPQREAIVMEVTEACWQAFVDDPYHPFRLHPGAKVRAMRTAEGVAALSFEPSGVFADRTTLSHPLEWRERLEAVSRWLAEHGQACVMVGISRSARSGYTPAALVAQIESALGEVLQQHLGAGIQSVSDWLGANP